MRTNRSNGTLEWSTPEDFRLLVNAVAEAFVLETDLPELVALKDMAESLIATSTFGPQYYLNMINPRPHGLLTYDHTVIVMEGAAGVLRPWTIARWHCPHLDQELTRICAARDGLHLYDAKGSLLVTFASRQIMPHHNKPHLIEESRKSFQRAFEVIEQFTGLERDHVDLARNTQLYVLDYADGVWTGQVGRTPLRLVKPDEGHLDI